MAEKNSSEVLARNFEDQLTCSVCLDQYNEPRTLPCLHSFCTKCLEGLPVTMDKEACFLSCPTCRAVTTLPRQGVTAFHRAFHLKNFMEVHELLKKMESKRDSVVICDNCHKTGQNVAGYCPDCDKLFCSSCQDVHRKWGPTSSHNLIDVNEVSRKASQMVPVKAQQPVVNCSSHIRPLDLYCVTCEQPICYHCTIKGHKEHVHDLLSDTYEESKKEINGKLEELTKKYCNLMEIKNELRQNQEKITMEADAAKIKLNLSFDILINLIHEGSELMLQTSNMVVQNKLTFEEQQVKVVDSCLNSLQHCKIYTEQCLQANMPAQLLVTKKPINTKIDHLLKSADECQSIVPQEVENFEESDDSENDSDVDEDLIFPVSYTSLFYKKCDCTLIKISEDVHQHEECTGSFKLSFHGRPVVINSEDISMSFFSEDNEIKCDISLNAKENEFVYDFSFTPENTGYYNLKLTLKNEKINIEEYTLIVK